MTQVASRYNDIKALNTNVVAISFGQEDWVRLWLEETALPFPVWLDHPKRQSYKVYGLEDSLLRSWGWNSTRYYIRAMLSGEKWRGYRGNMNQLGGNVIVDSAGIIRLVYPSRDPTDRPSAEALLAELRHLKG